MEVLMALLVGVLFGVSVYLLQQRNLLYLVLGLALIGQGANLAVLTLAGFRPGGAPPILVDGLELYTDPLPQALILTAVVIGFGVLAYVLVLGYRLFQEHGTDDMSVLREPHVGEGDHHDG